jgi:hypothetical protein
METLISHLVEYLTAGEAGRVSLGTLKDDLEIIGALPAPACIHCGGATYWNGGAWVCQDGCEPEPQDIPSGRLVCPEHHARMHWNGVDYICDDCLTDWYENDARRAEDPHATQEVATVEEFPF